MTRAHKISNLVGVVLPFVAFVAAVVLLWNTFVDWSDLAVLAIMYVLTGFGVTLGFHRLLTHRSFATFKPVEYLLASLGSMAVQGPVMTWVADHRKHHAHTDKEGDPHSPHGHGGGLKGAMTGLYHAHMGWLFDRAGMAKPERYAKDLYEDRGMHVIQKSFLPLVLAGFVLPFLLGWAIGGTLITALTGLLWGGMVRVLVLHHFTYSINSLCHVFGRRPYDTSDESRNLSLLALPTFGEAWHNNHHAFPTSAVHGVDRWQPDPSGLVIRGLERLGLIWDVNRVEPERRAELSTP